MCSLCVYKRLSRATHLQEMKNTDLILSLHSTECGGKSTHLKICTTVMRIHLPRSPHTLFAVISKKTSAYSSTVSHVFNDDPEDSGIVLRDSLIIQSLKRTSKLDIEYTNSVITLEF